MRNWYYDRIAGFFRGHLFSRISRISASRENIFRQILGATPSSCSAPTCFGLIAKIFFAKFAPLAIRENIGPRKNPAIRYVKKGFHSFNILLIDRKNFTPIRGVLSGLRLFL